MKINKTQAVDLLSDYVMAEAIKRAPLLPDEVTGRMFALQVNKQGGKMSADSARDALARWAQEGTWSVRTGIVGGKEVLVYRPVKGKPREHK